MPVVFRMPVGWLPVPLPLMAARSIANAITLARSERMKASMSRLDCMMFCRVVWVRAATPFGDRDKLSKV